MTNAVGNPLHARIKLLNRSRNRLEYFIRGLHRGQTVADVFTAAPARLNGALHIGLHGLHRLRDLLGELARLFGELTDFLGDNCESAPVLTCTRRFDGGIEREQVCLLRNARDDVNAVADLLRALSECGNRGVDCLRSGLDLLHVAHDFVNGVTPFADALDGIVRDRRNFLRTFRHRRRMR